MTIEIDVALLAQRLEQAEDEVVRLKDETLVKMQETLDKLELTMQRIQNIAIGMGLYYLFDSLGLTAAIKAFL
jgi:hypothetical protein